MGVRILHDGEQAVMYCSTTDWAFGPVFTEQDGHAPDERAESFLRWLEQFGLDVRHYPDPLLKDKYSEWRAQEENQWKNELIEVEEEDVESLYFKDEDKQ